MNTLTRNRIVEKLEKFQNDYGHVITALLEEANRVHLKGRGTVLFQPIIDNDILHWVLEWEQDRVSFDLNLVIHIETSSCQQLVRSVLVHRHARAPYDFAGHMPTTRMRRLAGFSVAAIKQAVQAEFVQDEFRKLGVQRIGATFVKL